MQQYDIVIIGGGPAGLAAAIAAKDAGIDSILILERENSLGGILNQCIHTGFGFSTFKEELSGPEYAQRFIDRIVEKDIPYRLNTMVLDLNREKILTAVNHEDGIFQIKAKAIVLAMGCRERPRGAINIPGSRCAGIFTAGAAQRFVNIDGYMPGKEVVILGSGDIGLIMARRMTLEGAVVKAVIEIMPHCGGQKRNVQQCLKDFGIPLKLSHTVIDIKGKDRVEGVTIVKVDESKKPVSGTEEFIPCDTLILSVGLQPENELSKKADVIISKTTGGPEVDNYMQTNIEGIFSCGNVLHVHDYVDTVTVESIKAGTNAASYVKGQLKSGKKTKVSSGEGVTYLVPKYINTDVDSVDNIVSSDCILGLDSIEEAVDISFRPKEASMDKYVSVYFDDFREIHEHRRSLSPGEMAHVFISKEALKKHKTVGSIIVKLEDK